MITLVGKVLKDEIAVPNSRVQVCVKDSANNIGGWSEVVSTDSSGRYQISFGDIRDLHQNFSDGTEILIAAWNDDLERTENHAELGTKVATYNGDALIVEDVTILDADQCDYYLVNSAIFVVQKERVPYTPVFESRNQKSMFHEERVFPQNATTEVQMHNGTDYISPFDIIKNDVGESWILVRGRNASGLSYVGSLLVTTTEAANSQDIDFNSIDIDQGLSFFVVKDRGISDNIFSATIFTSQRYTLTNAKFFANGLLVREMTDFSIPLVSISLSGIADRTRTMKMVTTGTIEGSDELVEYTYEKEVADFDSITGDISISLDANSGLHTAGLNINNSSEVTEILWQIVYRSTIVERVIKVTDAEEKALINILYQEYANPSDTTLEFEALQPGNYTVMAYVINSSGAFFKISEDLFVPGDAGTDQPIEVGDAITIGCLSNHGEVPILSVYRLSRDGYVEEVSVPMDHAYERTYFYDFTVADDDSFYIFKAADSVVVKKVGIPRGCAVAYSKSKESGRTIEYKLQDFNGNTIDEGTLDDSGFGVYYKVMSENVHGVLVIGKTYKVV